MKKEGLQNTLLGGHKSVSGVLDGTGCYMLFKTMHQPNVTKC